MNLEDIKKGRLIHGDCLQELKKYPSNFFDALISDPPYGLSYFALNWDKAIPSQEIWKECVRVLKPGAFAFIMSSVRQDVLSRMIVSLEEAGFNSRFSSLYWTYTTGFPKASNIGISIDKKLGIPSKIVETKIQERVKFKDMRDLGMKGQFCDASRIEYHVKEPASSAGKELQGGYAGFQPRPAVEAILVVMKPLTEKTYVGQALSNSKGITFLGDCSIPYIDGKMEPQKRFMSNLIVSDNALDLCGESNIEIECRSKAGYSYKFSLDAWVKDTLPHLMVEKAKKEKDLGLENLPDDNIVNREPGQRSFNVPMKQRPSDRKNIHPTVKPLKLMSYLVTLGSRPGDIILDPFCGSGTTCLAASLLDRRFLGIEVEEKYCQIAKERLTNISGVVKKEVNAMSIPPKTKKLSDIESITLRYHDRSVFDINALPGLMSVAFENPEAGVSIHDNVEITTALKPEDTHSKPDSEKNIPVTPTKEKDNVHDWADKTINLYKGCSNNCRYCYAREQAVRLHGMKYEDWEKEELNEKMVKKGWRLSKKNLMFPSTHDITPGTFDACATVLEKILKAGNTILIVSKPRADLIEKLCDILQPYMKQILFRFTISARNNEILSFWEPNAPSYEDRLKALKIAHEKGFNTSISMEPMLDPNNITDLIEDVRPYTTDSMWIGTMNMIGKRVRIDGEKAKEEIEKIKAGQTPEKLLEIYNRYKGDPIIKWKGHVRKVLKGIGTEVPEQKDDWRDRIKTKSHEA